MHAISKIQTRDFNNLSGADLRLRPHGQLDHQGDYLITSNYISVLTELNGNGGSIVLWYTVSFFFFLSWPGLFIPSRCRNRGFCLSDHTP